MDKVKTEKIARFVNDKAMSGAVWEVLEREVSKPRPSADVNVLAASFLAIGILRDAWKELEKSRLEVEEEQKSNRNIGL